LFLKLDCKDRESFWNIQYIFSFSYQNELLSVFKIVF